MDISSLRDRKNESVLTVGELNSYIKAILESDRLLSAVSVKGEISNFVYHRSGHLYFTLKDDEGQIKAVMFRSAALKLKFMPENGMKVTLRGTVDMYTKDGSVQFYVNQIEPDGIGALYLAYEQLKERLFKEGLFDDAHKRHIPRIPGAIGVITSPTGAAVRDIINILKRRFPLAKVYLYPALVQGEDAEYDLVKGIDYFDKSELVDTVIIGRGGGSIEDLWAFNSERLARRIFDAKIPIISAVGHESDFTICDFVSDLRAPTPSAAAELATPDIRELYLDISSKFDKAIEILMKNIEIKKINLSYLKENSVFKFSDKIFENRRNYLAENDRAINILIGDILSLKKNELLFATQKLDALSPLSTLKRGYAVVTKNDKLVKSVKELQTFEIVNLRFGDGEAEAEIKSKIDRK